METQQGLLQLEPRQLHFRDVRLHQAYTQTVKLSNQSKSTVDGSIRAGSADRYHVQPASFRLKPGESVTVAVQLKLLRFAHTKRAEEAGQRDVFHIKAPYFDQQFSAVFWLAPEGQKGSQAPAKLKLSKAPPTLEELAAEPLETTLSPRKSISFSRPEGPPALPMSQQQLQRSQSAAALQKQEHLLREKDEQLRLLQSRLDLAQQQEHIVQQAQAEAQQAKEVAGEVVEVQRCFRDAQAQAEASQEQTQKLLAANAELQARAEEAYLRDQASKAQIADLQAQLQQSPKPVRSPRPGHMEHKAAQLRAELEVHRDALAAANMEIALLSEQLGQARGLVQDLEAREAQETAHACRQQDVQHKEVMRLQEQVQELEALLLSAQRPHEAFARIVATKGEAKSSQLEDAWLGAHGALTASMDRSEAARASLEQDLQESSRKAASLQLQLNDKAASLDTATTALQELRQAHAKLQVQADSSAEQLAGAEEATCQLAQAAGLQKSSKQLPGQLLEAAITVEQLQGARAQLDGRCQSLDRQLAGACAERDACRNEVGCLSREADRLHSRCRELAASVQATSQGPVVSEAEGEAVQAAQKRAEQAEQQAKLQAQQLQQAETQLEAAQAEAGRRVTMGDLYSLVSSLESAVGSGQDPSQLPGGFSLPALARHLVDAKMGQAEAERQLRLQARQGAELQAQLQATAASRGRHSATAYATAQPEAEGGLADSAAEAQVADLRMAVSKRNAEVDFLEAELAKLQQELLSGPALMTSAELKGLQDRARQADGLQQKLREATHVSDLARQACIRALHRPDLTREAGNGNADEASEQQKAEWSGMDAAQITERLAAALKECEAELRQQKALASQGQKLRAKEREAAAAQPLEASQRAVIRDLSLKLALMERQLAASKADRSQVQERLHNLRASLGSSKAPQGTPRRSEDAVQQQQQQDDMLANGGFLDHPRRVPPSELEGLCTLLGLHLGTMEASQQPLIRLCQTTPASGSELLGAVQSALAQALAETGAMRSTLRVLCSSLPAGSDDAAGKTGTSAREAAVAKELGAVRKDLEQSHQQLQAAQQALSKAQGEAKAAAASAAAAEEASASQQTKLQEQLAQLGTEHAQAVTALQEALAGLQAAKQAGEASRRDNGALRENALHMRAVQEKLQAKLGQKAAKASEAQDKAREAEAKLRQAHADAELAAHSSTLDTADLRQQLGRQQEELRQLADHAQAASQQLHGSLSSMRQELQECRAPPSALLSQIEGLQGRLQDLQAVQSAHKAADEQLAREREASAKLQQDLVALAACKASDAAALSACEEKLRAAQQECAAQAEHCRQAEEAAQAAAAKQLKAWTQSKEEDLALEREALRREAAEAAAAQASAQDRLKAAEQARQTSQEEASAHASLLATLRNQFKAYQAGKAKEVLVLNGRLMALLEGRGRTDGRTKRHGQTRQTSSLSETLQAFVPDCTAEAGPVEGEFAAVHASESLQAALREADLERVQKEAAEAAAERLEDTCADLRRQIKAAQAEAAAVKERGQAAQTARRGSAAEEQAKLQAMQEALKAAQDALKLSRSEASSRLASVKELQEKLAAQPPDQSQAILARERLRGSELTQHLKQAKQALVKRGQLVEELRARAEQAGQQAKEASKRLHKAQADTERLGSECASKDTSLQQLRAAYDDLTCGAAEAEQAARQESYEVHAEACNKLETDKSNMQAELQQAQADAQAASKAMAAALQKAAAARGDCTAWKLRLDSTLGVLGCTADAVASLTAGALQAADVLTGMDDQSGGVGVEAIAKLVNMPAEDVYCLMCEESAESMASGKLPPRSQLRFICSRMSQQLHAGADRSPASSAAAEADSDAACWDPAMLQQLQSTIQQELTRAEQMLMQMVAKAGRVHVPGRQSRRTQPSGRHDHAHETVIDIQLGGED